MSRSPFHRRPAPAIVSALAVLALTACGDSPPASPGERHLDVTITPTQVVAGEVVTVSVAIRDARGRLDTDYRGPLTVEISDPAAVVGGADALAVVEGGEARFLASLRSTGTHRVRVRDAAGGALEGSAEVGVLAGPPTDLDLSLSSFEVTAGEAIDLELRVKDSLGNVAAFDGEVAIRTCEDDITMTAVAPTIPVEGGILRLTEGLVLRTAGVCSLHVHVLGRPGLTTTAAVDVHPAAPAALALTGPSEVGVNEPMDLAVEVQDAFGNAVPDYTGTLRFASSDPAAKVPSTQSIGADDGGRIALPGAVVFRASATQWVEAVDANDEHIRGRFEVEVTAGAPVSLILDVEPAHPVADGVQAAEIVVSVRDAFDNPVPGIDVWVSATGNDNALDRLHGLTDAAGRVEAKLRSTVAETKRVRAVIGMGDEITERDVVFVPGPATRLGVSVHPAVLAPGQDGMIAITARDAHFNDIPDWSGVVAVSSTDPFAEVPEPFLVTADPDSDATATLPPTVRFPAAGQYTLWAHAQTGELAGLAGVRVLEGSLGDVTVIQENEGVAETGGAWVGFETESDWPAGGQLALAFPEGYDVEKAAVEGVYGAFTELTVVEADGPTLVLASSEKVHGDTRITVGLSGIRNPPTVGMHGGLEVSTRLSDGRIIDRGESEPVVLSQRTFATCGTLGRFGPSQAACDGAYAGTMLVDAVTVEDGIQSWVVPETGLWRIEAFGAQGGAGRAGPGGAGARIGGDFELEAGQVLRILVGQPGSDGGSVGGGGGGTFVWVDGGELPLLVAGGGGGSGRAEVGTLSPFGGDGRLEEAGGDGAQTRAAQDGGTAQGGAGGAGGLHGTFYTDFGGGAGGAGWLTDGSTSTLGWCEVAGGGLSPMNGGLGGAVFGTSSGDGGFGGGGAARGACTWAGGGGGGGFSGGGGGGGDADVEDGGSTAGGGGGGGSFNAGYGAEGEAGVGFGPGRVTVRRAVVDPS